MEQDQRLGGWVRGVAEVVNVAVQAQAADDGGAYPTGGPIYAGVERDEKLGG